MKNSRRLTFAVGTGLLTASLSIGAVGCKKDTTVNTAQPDEPHVNPAPPSEETVNPVPDADPADEPTDEPADEPNVNTVPDDDAG